MNPENQTPPQIPPPMLAAPQAAAPTPTDRLEDQQPISSMAGAIEAVLRQPQRVLHQLRQPGGAGVIGSMLFVALAASLTYGVVVGSFSMGAQLWLAPLKIALGLFLAALICLPSLYIFACLAGSQARLIEIIGMVAGLLLLATLLLVGFAPVAWLFSQSSESVVWMGTLHLLFWLIAAGFGLRFLHQGFAGSQARSRAGFYAWIIIFLLVTLQMTTALRPLVGTADTLLPAQKKFFLVHWFDCMRAGLDTPERPPTRGNL